jgi:dTDP-4-amino-4,6-dideoxygalactose transaminase
MCNLGPADEVLTTPLTCTATNFAILATGARLRWVDVDPNTCNICLQDLARKLSPKTKAIMAVHWGGYPCDLDAIKELQLRCQELYGFCPMVIEDCAHAWGATYKAKLLGNHGNVCCFSFQAIKHFTTADGGLLVSPSYEEHQRAKRLRWYGLDRTRSLDFRCEQNIEERGFKYHMNDVNASIGLCNFPHAAELVAHHRSNGQFFNEKLAGLCGVQLMETSPDRSSSYWVYTLRVKDRAGFVKKMKERGIGVSQVHDRNDKHHCLKEFRAALPSMDILSQDMICIPCGWWVSDEDRQYIVDCIKEGW